MNKHFDCLSCDHSFSSDDDKLFCSLRLERVNENNICLNHTDLEYEFTVAAIHEIDKEFYGDSKELIEILTKLEND